MIGFHSTILLRSILITLCLITLCFAFPARGQTGRAAAACGAETNSAAMRICENARYEKAQQTLNSVSADLMQHLDAAGKRKPGIRLLTRCLINSWRTRIFRRKWPEAAPLVRSSA